MMLTKKILNELKHGDELLKTNNLEKKFKEFLLSHKLTIQI